MAIVRNREGAMFDSTDELIEMVLAELDEPVDPEHPDVSLRSEDEWCLSAFPSGDLIWENVETLGLERHMRGVPRSEVRRLWKALADGDLASIEAEPWMPGYGT